MFFPQSQVSAAAAESSDSRVCEITTLLSNVSLHTLQTSACNVSQPEASSDIYRTGAGLVDAGVELHRLNCRYSS